MVVYTSFAGVLRGGALGLFRVGIARLYGDGAGVQSPRTLLSGRAALDAHIARYAEAHRIPPSLIHAAVKRESSYNPGLKHGPILA